MSRIIKISISQPEQWVEIFKHHAKAEGMSLSEWIGEACKDRVVNSLASSSNRAVAMDAVFSPRPSKGPAKGTKRKPKEPRDEK